MYVGIYVYSRRLYPYQFSAEISMRPYWTLLYIRACARLKTKQLRHRLFPPQLSYANQPTVLRILYSTLLLLLSHTEPFTYTCWNMLPRYNRRHSYTSLLAVARFITPFTFYTSIWLWMDYELCQMDLSFLSCYNSTYIIKKYLGMLKNVFLKINCKINVWQWIALFI